MSELALVYAHGWAMDDWFWEPLRSALSDWKTVSGRETPSEPWVGIGHSLGFRQLAESDLRHCRGLVSLSGFLDFCGEGGTSQRVVQRMVKQFGRNPMEVLNDFYANCGIEKKPSESSETAKLDRELRSLLEKREDVEDNISDWKGIQVFAIAGEQDKIVPRELTQQQFANVTFHPDAGHGLGFEYSDWCANLIRQFLDSL